MYFLAVTGVLTSVIGAFYYIRFIKIMYFEKMRSWTFLGRSAEKSIVLGSTTMFILLFFVYPTPLMLMAHKLALTVCLINFL